MHADMHVHTHIEIRILCIYNWSTGNSADILHSCMKIAEEHFSWEQIVWGIVLRKLSIFLSVVACLIILSAMHIVQTRIQI